MERREALLIASSEYQDASLARLAAPPNDAQSLAEVLRDPRIGGFGQDDVHVLVNQSAAAVREAVAEFFSGRKKDDLLLFYFSGHGLTDDESGGRLHLATADTKRCRMRATGIAAHWLMEEMEISGSRRIVLILDCCFSGAFARGGKSAEAEFGVAFQNMGHGRVVLTASNAVQRAWEEETAGGRPVHSIFTKFMVEGLRTGAADLSQCGKISVTDLHSYVEKQLEQLNSDKRQNPRIWSFDQEGEPIVIACNPFWKEKKVPAPVSGKRPLTYTLRPQAVNFVDRDALREKLRTDLRDAAKVFVIVDGLAGIGKTMLAAKIAEEIEADFAGIYYTKCAKETDLDQILAELAYFLSSCGDQCLSGVVEYDIPAANKINFLLSVLDVRKYLLIFDDLHELLDAERQISNEGIRLLFSSLLDTRHQAKILLVSRVRPVLPWQQLCQVPNSLESFDAENGLEMFRLLGLDEDEALLRRAWQLTGGHPLAMGLLAGLAGTMDLQLILADTSLFYGGSLVNELLRRQFYTLLTAAEKSLLLRMSVLPRPAEFSIIAHLEEQGQAARLLPSLVEKNLVMYSRKDKQYRLHDLVREFSRAEMTAEEQRLCHSRLADYYERLNFDADKPSFEQVQQRLEARHHAFQAEEIARAARLLAETAEHLRKWGYLERCGALLTETLTALEQLEPSREHLLLRADLLVEQGWLARSSVGLDKAVEWCREAERIVQAEQDEGREGKVCHALGKFFYEEAKWDEAERYFARAFELQKAQRNSKEFVKILCDWRLLYWNKAGDMQKIEDVSHEGVKICEQASDTESKCKILIDVLGKTLENQSRFNEALAAYKDSLNSRASNDFSGKADSLLKMGEVFLRQNLFEEAYRTNEKSLSLAYQACDILRQAKALNGLGDVCRAKGDTEESVKFYNQCLEISGKSGVYMDIGRSYRDSGMLKNSFDVFHESLNLRRKLGNLVDVADSLNAIGFLCSTKYADLNTALIYYGESLEIRRKLGRSLPLEIELANIAAVYKKQGNFDEALKRFNELLELRKGRKHEITYAITLNL